MKEGPGPTKEDAWGRAVVMQEATVKSVTLERPFYAALVTTERGPPSVGAFDRPLPGQAHAAASRSQRSGPRWSWTALAVSAARLAPANLHTLAWLPRA